MKFIYLLSALAVLTSTVQPVSLKSTERQLAQLEAQLDAEEKLMEEWKFNWNRARERLLAAKRWAEKQKQEALERAQEIKKSLEEGNIADAVAQAKDAAKEGIQKTDEAAKWFDKNKDDLGFNHENGRNVEELINRATGRDPYDT